MYEGLCKEGYRSPKHSINPEGEARRRKQRLLSGSSID